MSDTTVVMDDLPKCSFCASKARFDFKASWGQWSYGCTDHYVFHRMYESLGVGKGQRLILKEEQENEHS